MGMCLARRNEEPRPDGGESGLREPMSRPAASSTNDSGLDAGNPEGLPEESVVLATSDRTETLKEVNKRNPGRQ